MDDTTFGSPFTQSDTRPPLRRVSGPIGGVTAGIARTFGVPVMGVRLVWAGLAFFAGPIAVIAYLLAWMMIPVDESLPISDQPASVPRPLLYIVGAIVAIQVVSGVIGSMPMGWIAVAAVAAWWFFFRNND